MLVGSWREAEEDSKDAVVADNDKVGVEEEGNREVEALEDNFDAKDSCIDSVEL